MAELSREAGLEEQENSRREARAHRILDAAATLILRWGYNKTTIEDISREAGVAKGTIYLHWKTREDLFGALMKREKVALTEDVQQRVGQDPEGQTLRGLFRHSALALLNRPLLKAVLLRDMDVIGKLVHREHSSELYQEKLQGFVVYLEYLREHRLVRTDMSLPAQVYTLSAIFMGFFLIAPLMPEEYMLSDEELARWLAEAVQRALVPDGADMSNEVRVASHVFGQYLDRDRAASQQMFQQEVE